MSGDGQGADAARWALQQVGWPYVWGGESREEGGFDCSGLVLAAWAHAGVDLPRVTTDQFTTGTPVELDELRPGDLLFYDTGGPGPPPAHVTMYVGEGQMVNAPSTGKKIRVEPVEGITTARASWAPAGREAATRKRGLASQGTPPMETHRKKHP
ncbi:C40 family peptidase [Nocardiopsis composta]